MSQGRSPNYPGLDLRKAIEKTQRVYQAHGDRSASRDSIARAMGSSSSTNGRSTVRMGALRAYDFLAGEGDELTLTPRAVLISTLADEPQHPDRVAAIREAAFIPDVFSEMQRRFGQAPDLDLSYDWLTNGGFTHKGAHRLIRIYRANLDYLNDLGRGPS